MSAPISTRTLRANGLDFAIDEAGEGPDIALCLHGFPESRQSWRHQLPALAALGWHAVAPDLRGYGQSSRPSGRAAYQVRNLIEDAAALFDALGARRRLLVAHDWGGVIAWAFALRRARALDGLVVMNIPHPSVFSDVIRRSWAQRGRSWYVLFFQLPLLPEALLRADGARAIGRAFTRNPAGTAAFPVEVLDRYRANAMQPGAMTAMLNYYRANFAGMLRARQTPPVIEVPTLMIWGERDTALGLELTRGHDAYVEDFELHTIPRATHWVQQDAPDEVNAILGGWLGRKRLVPTSVP